jgi:hypothetical protein
MQNTPLQLLISDYHQRDGQAKLSDLLKQTKFEEATRITKRLFSSLVRL